MFKLRGCGCKGVWVVLRLSVDVTVDDARDPPRIPDAQKARIEIKVLRVVSWALSIVPCPLYRF